MSKIKALGYYYEKLKLTEAILLGEGWSLVPVSFLHESPHEFLGSHSDKCASYTKISDLNPIKFFLLCRSLD